MTNPNTPSSSAESTNKTTSVRQNLAPLLKKSIKSSLGKGDGIDPRYYPIANKDQTIQDIRQKMKDLRDEDPDWSETSDDAIQNISNSQILTEVEIFASPLRNARKTALNRIYKIFPKLRDELAKDKLENILSKKDEHELSEIYHSRANIKKFIKNELKIPLRAVESSFSSLKEIFGGDIDILKHTDPKLYGEFEKAQIDFERGGWTPPKSLVRSLFVFYKNNKAKKNEIARYFGITFSLKEALMVGLMSDVALEKVVKREFDHIWLDLDMTSREKLIRKIKSDDTVELSLDEIDGEKWGNYLDTENVEELLTNKAYTALDRESDGKIDEHPTNFESFIERLSEMKHGIKNIENWDVGSVMVFKDRNGNTHYFLLEEKDVATGRIGVPGMRLSSLEGLEAGTIGQAKGQSNIAYTDLIEYIKSGTKEGEVMSLEVLRAKATKDKESAIDEGGALDIRGEEKIWDMSDIEDLTTLEALTDAIGRIDPDGKEINEGKVAAGVSFSAEASPEEGGKKGVYTIKKLDNGYITISGAKEDETTSYEHFIEIAEKQNLRRVAYLDPENADRDMLKSLGKYGVDTDHTTLESNGNLTTEIEEHEDDGHGHSTTKKIKGKYEFFKANEGNGHIRIGGIQNGFVYFGEYDSSSKLEDVQKAKKAKKLSKKEEKGLYRWRTIPYGAFLAYLEENKLTATTENLLDPGAKNIHEPHEHFEGSIFSKIGKLYSVGDIMKGISNLGHHIEHYFEKTAKLNASRVTLGMAKKLGLPADIIAQAQSEEVASVKEIIEKLKDKLGNLNGPHGRTKALHIAHNKDARPEEVAAAMLHMARGYGQLYAEDIAYAQGSYSFLNGFLNACGFRDEASRKAMRQKAREKFLSDMGNEGGEPTEEEIIWGFMKTMDGKYEEYPVAATVVKAMGGPSGWEKTWRTEGFEGAYEKGKRQGGDTVNAQGRVNKGLSALITHEFNSAIGFMEKAAGKDPDPSRQTIPVVWALAGYSQYVGTNGSQKVKGFGDSMGHTFHAYAFLRNKTHNDIYKNAFRAALKDIAPNKVEQLDKYIEIVQRNNHHDAKDNEKMKDAIYGIASIWQELQGKGLHDMLQGKNGWLIEQVNSGNREVKEYLKILDGIHLTNSGENPPPDNDWMQQYGYNGSPMVGKKELDGKTVLSLERTLKKIRISSHSFDMDRDRQDRLWPSIIERIKRVKDIKDPELRRTQYNQYRQDLLVWFRNAINTRGSAETALEDLKKKSYYKDLLSMGIDPSIIVVGGETEKVIRSTSGEDFIMWLGGGRGSGNMQHETVADIISDTSTKAGRRMYQQGVNSGSNIPYREEGTIKGGGGLALEDESDG